MDIAFNQLQEFESLGDQFVQLNFPENAEIQDHDEIQSAQQYHLTCTPFTTVA